MKPTTLLKLIPAALLPLSIAEVTADTAVSPPLGFNKVQLQNQSDTIVSVPFHKQPAFTGILGGPLTAPADDGGTAEVDESTWRILTPPAFPSWIHAG